eukprot:6457551-Pyramimonas_sp.AAC.1
MGAQRVANPSHEVSPKVWATFWRVSAHLPRKAAAATLSADMRPRPPSTKRKKHCAFWSSRN